MATNTIVNGIGSPRVWLYTSKDQIMRDYDEQPVSKYLTSFSYTYNEEQDDECRCTFKFKELRSFDLPYFRQDIIFEVEWGYVSNGGLIIKSPRRMVAIRDLEVTYEAEGIKLILVCTDLVSYIKGMKTKTTKNYSQEPGSSSSDRFLNDSVVALGMYINERTSGSITFTQRRFDETLRINTSGELKVRPNKNPLLNSINKNNIIDRDFMTRPRAQDFIVKGNAKSFDWLMRKQLENVEKERREIEFGQAPIMDTTDNNLEIKYRDFSQPIFKTYTWFGGNGELLGFNVTTNTRKNKDTKSASSAVDPFTKTITHSQVDAIDTAKYRKYSKSDMDAVFNKIGQNFKSNYMSNGVITAPIKDKIVVRRYKGKEISVNNSTTNANQYTSGSGFGIKPITLSDYKDGVRNSNVTEKDIYEFRTYNYSDILQSPDWKTYLPKKLKSLTAPVTKDSTVSRLSSYTVENINRKFEAEAKTIGDPTIIKGKIYQFNNLRKEDTGKWYAMSSKHEITMENGYICTIGLMRNPKPVGLSSKTVAINPVFDRKTNTLDMKAESEEGVNYLFEQNDEDNQKSVSTIDNPKSDKVFRESSPIDGMIERSEVLKSEKDIIDNLDSDPEYKVAQNELYVVNKPNTEEN